MQSIQQSMADIKVSSDAHRHSPFTIVTNDTIRYCPDKKTGTIDLPLATACYCDYEYTCICPPNPPRTYATITTQSLVSHYELYIWNRDNTYETQSFPAEYMHKESNDHVYNVTQQGCELTFPLPRQHIVTGQAHVTKLFFIIRFSDGSSNSATFKVNTLATSLSHSP